MKFNSKKFFSESFFLYLLANTKEKGNDLYLPSLISNKPFLYNSKGKYLASIIENSLNSECISSLLLKSFFRNLINRTSVIFSNSFKGYLLVDYN